MEEDEDGEVMVVLVDEGDEDDVLSGATGSRPRCSGPGAIILTTIDEDGAVSATLITDIFFFFASPQFP